MRWVNSVMNALGAKRRVIAGPRCNTRKYVYRTFDSKYTEPRRTPSQSSQGKYLFNVFRKCYARSSKPLSSSLNLCLRNTLTSENFQGWLHAGCALKELLFGAAHSRSSCRHSHFNLPTPRSPRINLVGGLWQLRWIQNFWQCEICALLRKHYFELHTNSHKVVSVFLRILSIETYTKEQRHDFSKYAFVITLIPQ